MPSKVSLDFFGPNSPTPLPVSFHKYNLPLNYHMYNGKTKLNPLLRIKAFRNQLLNVVLNQNEIYICFQNSITKPLHKQATPYFKNYSFSSAIQGQKNVTGGKIRDFPSVLPLLCS